MLRLGDKKVGKLYLGDKAVKKCYLGDSLVYSAFKPKQVGDIVDWAGYTWIVVNDNGDGTIVLAMQNIYELTAFGLNSTYAGSTLATRAKAFENSLSAFALAQAVETTVNGVTGKVFAASEDQLFLNYGGFSYFKDNASRIASYNGSNKMWWTSSDSKRHTNDVRYATAIYTSGNWTNGGVKQSYGFRPFVTVKQF